MDETLKAGDRVRVKYSDAPVSLKGLIGTVLERHPTQPVVEVDWPGCGVIGFLLSDVVKVGEEG